MKQAEGHICATAHALCAALNSTETFIAAGSALTERDAVRVYETACSIQPVIFEGRTVPGSSALLACKAACHLGLISSYEHAFGIDHALEALVLGPVMTGINWYTSFDCPAHDSGLVEVSPGALVRGGHEVVAYAIDAEREHVWLWNSWGTDELGAAPTRGVGRHVLPLGLGNVRNDADGVLR